MINAQDIVVGYKEPVAGPLTFSFKDGACVMLTGPNGSGKSTLLKTLAGLIKPLSGSFEANGRVVMVPTHIPKVKGFTVREFVLTGMLQKSGIFGRLSKASEEAASKAIRTLGLEGLASKDLSQISDGEFQKACIASALTGRAAVLILDEPTAFLDVDNRVMVLSTLQDIAHTTGATVIFSTHDIYDGQRYSDSQISLRALKH